jgi:hypothetical protein
VNLTKFFAELKRRNVYKVAVAYAVVAWLLMQIATQVFPFLEVPNWMVRAVAKPNALTKSSTSMNKPTTSTQTSAERPTFASDIRPILQSRCQPCHFQGGQMYEKLPFDKPETITKLGTKLFTRIKNEDEQRVIREFLSKRSASADR